MKRLSDSLALAGKPVELNDFIQHVLTGLDSSDYESLVTSVLARGDKIGLDEFYSLLLSHENRVKQRKGKIASDVTHNLTANIAQKQYNSGKNAGSNQKYNNGTYGGAYNSSFGGNSSRQSGDLNSTIICQIYFISGHGANKCINRYNSTFVPSRNQARGAFNGNFRPGQRNFGRGFGNAGGRYFNGTYGRGFYPHSGNMFGQPNFGNSNMPRGSGYQGYMMYSDPTIFYVAHLESSSGASPSAPAFCSSGDYNSGCSSSAPLVLAPEIVKDPTWYIDSSATNHITNDSGKLLAPKLTLEMKNYLLGMVPLCILISLD
ncbi:hypothetical protein AB3S75_047351 [Citrus x aurantiifolia]